MDDSDSAIVGGIESWVVDVAVLLSLLVSSWILERVDVVVVGLVVDDGAGALGRIFDRSNFQVDARVLKAV